jgi:glycosyltransferase involved in cell wall biosynthesis
LRVLLLNWRDVRSPRAGGAEILTHEIARRLVQRGHEVTWFTSQPQSLPREEEIDGIRIVRRGSELTTRFYAPMFARQLNADVVVEEVNTLPYFSPGWSHAPAVLFIMQLARDIWWYEAPRLLAPVGFAAEPLYLRAYRSVNAITISASSLGDLRRLGLRGDICVIPVAVSPPALADLPPKTPQGRLVFVARLVPSKRVLHAVRALAELRKARPAATLAVLGTGPELEEAKELAARLGVSDAVSFRGRVTEDEKISLLQASDLLIACSVREGWGLTVTEAARRGTPAAAYDVPGLRDSILDGRTGVLTPPEPVSLATAAESLLRDPIRYKRTRHAAWDRARQLSWERTTNAFEHAVQAATSRGEPRRTS